MKKNFFVFFALLNLGFISSLQATTIAKTESNKPHKPIISVSIPPQAYFVRKIAGDTLEINVIIPAGTDEHNFDFKPSTMKKLEQSDIYFGIGLEIEKNLVERFKSIASNLRIIDTGTGLRNNTHSHHIHHTHNQHLQDDEHNDPHIWLDPLLVKIQADIIAEMLIASYPQNKTLYETNLAAFKAELDILHEQILALLIHKKGKKFIVYHPSWGYFAARYNLVQIPVEFEGKEPKPRDLQRLISTAKKEKIDTIFVQKGFPQSAAKNLAKELNADVIEIDHLSEDWQNELLKSAEKLGQ